MSTLLSEVVALLRRQGAPHAIVGAAALAVRGVSRSTLDLDLLTTDRSVLRQAFWSEIASNDAQVEIRIGDISDPLVGVVRLSRDEQRPVDVIVGEGRWQEGILAAAQPHTVAGVDAPVIDEVGIILMKLYAGGPQDLWDIRQLLAVSPDPGDVARRTMEQLAGLPRRCRTLWERFRAE